MVGAITQVKKHKKKDENKEWEKMSGAGVFATVKMKMFPLSLFLSLSFYISILIFF
jgi:hypothetical protein